MEIYRWYAETSLTKHTHSRTHAQTQTRRKSHHALSLALSLSIILVHKRVVSHWTFSVSCRMLYGRDIDVEKFDWSRQCHMILRLHKKWRKIPTPFVYLYVFVILTYLLVHTCTAYIRTLSIEISTQTFDFGNYPTDSGKTFSAGYKTRRAGFLLGDVSMHSFALCSILICLLT